jgi:hypothetical protein
VSDERQGGAVHIRIASVVVAACLAGVTPAFAQPAQPTLPQRSTASGGAGASARAPGRPGAFELSLSALWLAPSSLGSADANLKANDTAGSAYRLFAASGDFVSAPGLEARASLHLTRMFAIEGGVTYSRPSVKVTIANDAEGAAGLTINGETASQFFVDASLVMYPTKASAARRRLRPFVEFGVGYLRELHGQSGATSGYFSKETGQVYHAGGGARYYFRTRSGGGLVKAYGLRFDARYYFRNGGFSFGTSNVNTFTAGAGLVLGF